MNITDVPTVASDAVVVESVAAATGALRARLRVCADVVAIMTVTTPRDCYSVGVRDIKRCQYHDTYVSGMILMSLLHHLCQYYKLFITLASVQ